MAYKDGKYWWKSLEVGDEVCDCRYKHLKVVDIQREFISRPFVDFYVYTPDWFPLFLDDIVWFLQGLVPTYREWIDSILTLEDGANCSASNCCDPVDHSWNHSGKSCDSDPLGPRL